ncbi:MULTISPECIES: helix-turn-helix domain-containing protein [unclassified Caballeronia]|uniref:XRE family transcriptional regulator n=1 Tax=unclassified Caballeronia TaxID=2646786 RepID=UPI002864A0B9|nr:MULTISPECIES: helix-turn-helix domain-containing protein [unclassified Caballeronia]MDR5776253.1 helix-turn-helix domain-containing protein [Caballeronia sp. LZ002]MDR5851693.1 helix-turn-helix domain-containing protein [Caballeronia sp. LZ003]
MNIHEKIKHLRTEAKLSQKELGAALGVSYQTVQQWENGKSGPRRERMEEVAKALNTSAEYLLFGPSISDAGADTSSPGTNETTNVPVPLQYSVDVKNFRRVYVVGRAQGGLPERIWTDGDYPVGATDEYAEIATTDPHAFLSPILGTSMVPKFNPGDFVFVEPGTPIEVEDDVLVRLGTGETMIKRLISKRGGIQLGSYNEPGTMLFKPEEITWMYYIAHYVPARKIKQRM